MARVRTWHRAALAVLGLALYLIAFLQQTRLAGLAADFDQGLAYPLRISGLPAETPGEAHRLAEASPVGARVQIEDARGHRAESILIRGRPWPELLTILLSGMLYLGTAIFILAPRRDRPGIRELFAGIFLFGLSVVIGGVYAPRDPLWLGVTLNWLQLGCLAVLPVLFVLLALQFPRASSPSRRRRVAGLVLGILAGAGMTWQGLAFHRYYDDPGGHTAAALEAALNAGRALLVAQVASGFVILFRRGRRLELTREKALLKWVLWGFTVGLFPYVFLRELPNLLGLQAPLGSGFDRAFELAIPLILLFIVARYRFLDIDLIIRRSLIYAVFAAGLVAIYLGFGLLLGLRFLDPSRRSHWFLLLGIGMVAGVLFRPLRERIGAWVDRSFFKLSHDYQVALAGLERRLESASSPAEVICLLDQFLDTSLLPALHAVTLDDEDGAASAGNLDDLSLARCLEGLGRGEARAEGISAAKGTTSVPEIELAPFPREVSAAGIVLYRPLSSPSVPGWLLLGPKRSGWRYIEPDLKLVQSAATLVEGHLEKLHWVRAAAVETMEHYRFAALDQMKSDFLSRVSHDLRTPLASIAWSTENLLDGLAGELAPPQAEYLRSVRTSTSHLNRLVENLLEISRMDQGGTRISPASVDLAAVIGTAVIALRPLTVEKKIRFEEPSEPGPAMVEADPEKILQVMMNLLDNAIKYSPPGGAVEIRIGPAGEARRWFSVRDHGPGLGSSAPENLFERFRQGAPSPHSSEQGFGLGLFVVKSVLDLMGGTVTARTHPDGGAEFTVGLPTASKSRETA